MASFSNASASSIAAQVVVTAKQMQQVEETLFAAGMPIAALMEKVAERVAAWVVEHYPRDRYPAVSCLVGPGHNGGDALVVARELHHQGYRVKLWCPFDKVKDLTAQHQNYASYVGILRVDSVEQLQSCDFLVDGGFGMGLTRPLSGALADGVRAINAWDLPVVSIDLPSGIATDSGEVLGIAIRAQDTLCLGLWKLGLLQDQAIKWTGRAHLIPFDIPAEVIGAALKGAQPLRRITLEAVTSRLPLPRSLTAHKYKMGHALLIAGSFQYSGAALLAAQGALASGVGMLTIVVPASLKLTVVSQVPEALVIGAPETDSGAIAELPEGIDWEKYDIVACGPGLTVQAAAVMKSVLESDRPLVLDADGLNWLSQHDPQSTLQTRSAPTLLTPHPGEFRRLFPDIWQAAATPTQAAQQAAQAASCTLVMKGAISAVAHSDGQLWFNPESTPALARGGSGDVLTGLVAGLAAQQLQSDAAAHKSLLDAAIAAVWWHAQAGRSLAQTNTVLGCNASKLAAQLDEILAQMLINIR